MDFLLPVKLLKDAQKAVPAVKYASGIAGVASVVALVAGIQIDLRIAFFGIVVVLGLMFVLLVFSTLVAHAGTELMDLAKTAAWSFVILVVVTSTLLMTSYFFSWPRSIESYIPPAPSKLVEYKRKVDFSRLGCLPDGKKSDIVIFTDTVKFLSKNPPNIFRRAFNTSTDADIQILDLVSGETITPVAHNGGAEKYGDVTFTVDKASSEARFQWTYKDAHSTGNEGVGFSSAEPNTLKSVDVDYLLPSGAKLENRHFTPLDLETKCTRKSSGFHCENLLAANSFQETWQWNIWENCP